MNTKKWLELLSEITLDKDDYIEAKEYMDVFNDSKRSDIMIDSALVIESIFEYIFDIRNIPDDFFEAYSKSFTNSSINLFEHFAQILENESTSSTIGFVSNLKGKLFELRAIEELVGEYPELTLNIAEKANQPIWDIIGSSIDGTVEYFQVKIGTPSYLAQIAERIEDNPDLKFILSNELFEKACEKFPNLKSNFVNVDISNEELTNEVFDKLDVLIENFGIDVPDEIGELIPYIGEIALGIKLILELKNNKSELKYANVEFRNRVAIVRTIAILSKFGIKTIIGLACGAIGAPAGPLVSLVASLGGIGVSSKVIKEVEPDFILIIYKILCIDEMDLYYFKNKSDIDLIGFKFSQLVVKDSC